MDTIAFLIALWSRSTLGNRGAGAPKVDVPRCSTRQVPHVALSVLHFSMTRIGVRELRQNASQYLEKVKAGETVEVTDRGELVALLIPPTPAATVRDRLIREGRLIPAKGPWTLPDLLDIPPGAPSTAEALEEQRADLAHPPRRGPS